MRLGMGSMHCFGARSALVAGAIGLAIAVGAVGVVATQRPGAAHAQDIDTQFAGIIELLPADGVVGIWQVSGRQVLVTEFTEIDSEGQALVPGMHVEVEGIGQEGGPVLATEIEVEEAHHGGVALPSMPGLPGVPSGARRSDDDD
jgi:hypothetical protein